ncbi:MAG TPA: hypothetical protein VE526_14540 [Solirubrobacteraceae bacterium]|jgi:hypothetical protein|nr:hypothetical protein [Solirubrobacteraceae bacterium]
MLRALAGTVVALALAPAAPAAAGPLERFAPVVVHDSRETSPLTSVEAFAGAVANVPEGTPEPTVYGRRAGRWLQYWMLFAANDQDRGLLRTGRHAGDWEMVQYAVRDGRLVRGVYGQHSGAERCPAGAIRMTPRGRPSVFLANGSHAAYFVPGVRDRTWPDPNDHADGKGLRVRPRLIRITAQSPAWMTDGGRWGGARAGWVPGEMDSPRGPAFQPQGRWSDPDAWARSARTCTRRDCDRLGECDQTETALAGGVAGIGALMALVYGWRRSRRATAPEDVGTATPRPAGR